MKMRELLRDIREFGCHLTIYPRMTRTDIIYKLSIRLHGDVIEVCSQIAKTTADFEQTAHHLLVDFHKKAEGLGLVPIE
jgi:hypothetical protein